MNRKLQKLINYTDIPFSFYNFSISRRNLLRGFFGLLVVFTIPHFKTLSKNAEILLISLGTFDLTEGARIDDLAYVSELSEIEFKTAIRELTKSSLIYYQGQNQYPRFFLL